MINLYPGFKVSKVYLLKRGGTFQRLRARINGRAYWCGKAIPGTSFWVSYICMDGEVRIQSGLPGGREITISKGEL
jgi:hypothetical protein